MSNSELKKRLWLPWKAEIDDDEVRLTSDDVYEALDDARKTILYTAYEKNCPYEATVKKKRTIAILQALENGLREMFQDTLDKTPALTIPGGKK